MYELEVENKNGQKLKLTQNENKYQILQIDGLTPPKAKIDTIDVVNVDGAKFKSSKLEMRNLVLTIKINGDVEKNRIALYDFFMPSQWCKITHKSSLKTVYIECYCETNDCDLFENGQTAQISLLCPKPYWINLVSTIIDISKKYGNFTFPFSIEEQGIVFASIDLNKITRIINYGEVSNGMIITIKANDTVSNPVIYNYNSGEYIKVNKTMQQGEKIVINTELKTVYSYIDSIETNIINYKDDSSTWLELSRGNNFLTYNSDSNSDMLDVVITHNSLYAGV